MVLSRKCSIWQHSFLGMMGLFKVVSIFYILWFFSSVLLLFSTLPLSPLGTWISLYTFVCIGFYLLLASSLSFMIMKSVCAQQHKLPLFLSLAFTIVCWLVVFFIARHHDGMGAFLAIIGTGNLLVLASITGSLLSSAIKRMAEFIPICITAAIADISSVLFGPTGDIAVTLGNYYEGGMAGPPPFFDFVVIKVIVPGYNVPVPLFGVTDWIVLVLLSSALLRLGKSDNLVKLTGRLREHFYLPITACALLLSVFLAQFSGVFLPALPVMSLVFISFLLLKYWGSFTLQRSDMVMSVVFPAIIATTVILAYR